jgi:hypothetical protein
MGFHFRTFKFVIELFGYIIKASQKKKAGVKQREREKERKVNPFLTGGCLN